MKKPRFRLDWQHDDDDDDEWFEDDEDLTEEGDGHLPTVEGPSYAPVFTGILNADGSPVLRHPVVMRLGFHPPDKKFHCPTLEDNGFGEDDGRIHGWVYD